MNTHNKCYDDESSARTSMTKPVRCMVLMALAISGALSGCASMNSIVPASEMEASQVFRSNADQHVLSSIAACDTATGQQDTLGLDTTTSQKGEAWAVARDYYCASIAERAASAGQIDRIKDTANDASKTKQFSQDMARVLYWQRKLAADAIAFANMNCDYHFRDAETGTERFIDPQIVDQSDQDFGRRRVDVDLRRSWQDRHEWSQTFAHIRIESTNQRQFANVGERLVGGEIRHCQRLIVVVLGPTARARVGIGIQPVGQGLNQVGRQLKGRQQAPQARQLLRHRLSRLHQVVKIEKRLLILDVARQPAIADIDGRRSRGPRLAGMIDRGRATIFVQEGAGPVDTGVRQNLGLRHVGLQLAAAHPAGLDRDHRAGGNRGQCDHAQCQHDGETRLPACHDLRENTRSITSLSASFKRNRTARGGAPSSVEGGQLSTHPATAL